MNIDRLKLLADTVEKGVVVFPELDINVAFTMTMTLEQIKQPASWMVPHRIDIPDPNAVNFCGCLMGFTVLLFSNEKEDIIFTAKQTNKSPNWQVDFATEARLLLDLPKEIAFALFFGRLSSYVTGARAARVVRSFLYTGTVDWLIQ